MEDKDCCKWCRYCLNIDLNNDKGKCALDIGEFIENTETYCCSSYRYDDNLDRC